MKKIKRPIWMPVVAALIHKKDRYLLGLRPKGGLISQVWEFPGGKVEPGESPTVALARELSEELGVEAQVGSLLLASSHSYGEINILLLFYEVTYWKGEPKPIHHEELKWVTFQNISQMDLPDANRTVLPQLETLLGEKYG